jgi:homoserine O-acetyltransferase
MILVMVILVSQVMDYMNFPKYTYDDMVLANYKLLTEHLNVNHLRLVMGTSMGGMQWVWGYLPDFMDAIMPLASLPVEIAGRNRMQRDSKAY